MQDHLSSPNSAKAYLLAHGGIKDLSETKCGNTYSASGRSGRQSGLSCPGKLVRTVSRDTSTPDFEQMGWLQMCNREGKKSQGLYFKRFFL